MVYGWHNPIIISLRGVNTSEGFLIVLAISFAALWAVLVYTRDWRTRRERLMQLARHLPGPPTLPVVGNALTFAGNPDELFNRVVGVIVPYEDVTPMRVWMGSALYVIVTAPRDIEIILNSQQATNKGAVYKYLFPFIGDGLISGSGEYWRSHRKMFVSTLNPRILREHIDIFDRRSRILMEKLNVLADGRVFDIFQLFEKCTIDVVCEAVMGCTDINAQDNPDHEFIESNAIMYKIVYERIMKIWLQLDLIFTMSWHYKRQCEAQGVIRNFVEKCIAAKRMDLLVPKIHSPESSSSVNEGVSILERILKVNNVTHELSDEELRDEIFTVYLASQDTMAVTSSFVSLMLAMNQDVQTKARQEVQDVLSDDEPVTSESLSRLKYLEMVIKETLRLFPIAPLIARGLRDELTLDNCTLPKNCQVIIAAYVTHRSCKYWTNPDCFMPERFSSEENSKRHRYAFIPFSGGSMGCIGQKYALLSLKTIIARLLQTYRITTNIRMQDIKLRSDISIRSIDGYNVSLEPLSQI